MTLKLEKERVKQLIDQAMRGLEESGRITEQHQQHANISTTTPLTSKPASNQYYSNQLTNEINENKSALAHIENALQK